VNLQYFVYILASRIGGTLYIGVTNDLLRRAAEHRGGAVDGFTKKHGVKRLVYFEAFDDIDAAIAREKQLKGWNRVWKIRLIEKDNPNWDDLYPAFGGGIACVSRSASGARLPSIVTPGERSEGRGPSTRMRYKH
jgi:putative endonuclease